jgi:ATP-dependent Clp protease ATP-binding subunit ClpA
MLHRHGTNSDQGGLLTEAINKHPHSVLLDKIEKAHLAPSSPTVI